MQKFEDAFILVLVAIIAVVGYLFWDSLSQLFCSFGIGQGCNSGTTNTPPITGQEGTTGNESADNSSLLNRLDASAFGSSSESYSSALSETFSHPLDTLSSIF